MTDLLVRIATALAVVAVAVVAAVISYKSLLENSGGIRLSR